MKAIVKGNIIKCPICHTNEFYVKEDVEIRGTVTKYHEDHLYDICKDELQCENCGWTGYFENNVDSEKDYKLKKITYTYDEN